MSKTKVSKPTVTPKKQRDVLTPLLDEFIGKKVDAAFHDCLRAAREQSKGLDTNAIAEIKSWCRNYVYAYCGGTKLNAMYASATCFFVFGAIYFIAELLKTAITLLGN